MTSEAEIVELQAKLASMSLACEKLSAFVREVVRVECWGYQPELDGSDVQDLAKGLGIIEPAIATASDAETMNDVCAGDSIFKFAPWVLEHAVEERAASKDATPEPSSSTIDIVNRLWTAHRQKIEARGHNPIDYISIERQAADTIEALRSRIRSLEMRLQAPDTDASRCRKS